MISKLEFKRRRNRLMGMMAPDSIAIFTAASEKKRNGDTLYPFRQDSDFFYLTCFPEPEAVAVLLPERKHGQFVLFCREKDAAREIWDGYRAGPEGACNDYDADDAFPIDDIDDILPGLLEGKDRVYYAMGKSADFDNQLMSWVNGIRSKARSGATPPGEFVDSDHLVHELRLFKSPGELKVMRKAAEISATAHRTAMQLCKPGLFEYQLQAEIEHRFALAGGRHPAYTSIVGGGENGCILHYIENSQRLRDGDLVLIDAGCELQHYASDITRTFPVNGKFSGEQRAIYEIVLEAQLATIDTCRAGNHWNDPHETSVRIITQGLVDLKLLKGDVSNLIEKGAYTDFYMHRAGHWLGMDVHDVGDYKVESEWRLLEPNMVMTVEPGIYISPNNTKVAKKWRGIGVRIEDDVVITDAEPEVLSAAAPKQCDAIEALMAG